MDSGVIKKPLYWFLMILPNLLNPNKLLTNLRHPIHEVFHTGHNQYQLTNSSYYVVEHDYFGKLVTIDLVESAVLPKSLLLRIKEIFRRDFYYGHCEYFPQTFRLLRREYVRNEDFNLTQYLERFI